MKKVSFMTGTRADFGKIKPYITYLLERKIAEVFIFITGMHMDEHYGNTRDEIERDLGTLCHLRFDNDFQSSTTAQETAHIISAYDIHLRQDKIDFCFIHGDRSEAFAGATAAVFNNIGICHIEAGDLSGSIDESLRHAISKLSHRFFVADDRAKDILIRMGENPDSVFITGNSSLAYDFKETENAFLRAELPFDQYAVLIYHPVTTMDKADVAFEIEGILKAIEKSNQNFVVIMPNNDLNSDVIRQAYKRLEKNPRFYFVNSLPFDVFNAVLKKARFLIGNSSCGIKEAPYYNVPCLDIGLRQKGRATHLNLPHWFHLDDVTKIFEGIERVLLIPHSAPCTFKRKETFFKSLDTIFTSDFWNPEKQKQFNRSL